MVSISISAKSFSAYSVIRACNWCTVGGGIEKVKAKQPFLAFSRRNTKSGRSSIHCMDTLNPDDLKILVNELHEVRAKWYHLGVQLNMTVPDLDAIKCQFMNNPDECLLRMLSAWLSKEVPSSPSWQRVVDALYSESINKKLVAEKIKASHYPNTGKSDTKGHCRFFSIEEIKSEMDKLELEFEELKDDVFVSIKDKPVDIFKVKLTSFRVREKEYHMDYMQGMIQTKDTITDIWVGLNCYLNFLIFKATI